MPVIRCNAALSSALHGAVWCWQHPAALYGAGSPTGAPEKAIGMPGSMLIGPCVTGGKLGPVTSKGAVIPALVRAADWM